MKAFSLFSLSLSLRITIIREFSVVEQQAKPLLVAPTSHIAVLLQAPFTLLLIQLPADTPGRQQLTAQVLESLPPRWETRLEFLPTVPVPGVVPIWGVS